MSNFYLLFVVRKIILPTGETTVFGLRAEHFVNLKPQRNAMLLWILRLFQCVEFSVSQLNPSILNLMVILF